MVLSLKILSTKLPHRLSKNEQCAKTTFPELLRDFKAKLKESKDQTNYRFQKLLDVQAHSKAVEKLKLNYDHTRLFSVGADGVVAIYSIHDKENNRKNAF